MTTKAAPRKPAKPKSIVESQAFIDGDMSVKDIHEEVANDDTKRYHLQIKPGAPLVSYTICGITIDYRTRPIDPVTRVAEINHGAIMDLSPRLVEVIKYNLAHQVVTVNYDRDPDLFTVDKEARRFHSVECYKSRKSALARVKKESRMFLPGYKEPVGVRELMSDWVMITETTAESAELSMILKLENEELRNQMRDLRAKLSSKDEK